MKEGNYTLSLHLFFSINCQQNHNLIYGKGAEN